jgi:hypothetical protein
MLPLLETKIFNRNAVKGHQRFSLNLCNVSTTPPFQNLLHPWGQKMTQGARSGEQVWWNTTTILFLAKNCWILKAVWAYSVFKKIAQHTCRHLEKYQKNWHKACSAMSLSRLVQNIVSSLYLVAEPWTVLFVWKIKFQKYLGPPSYGAASTPARF